MSSADEQTSRRRYLLSVAAVALAVTAASSSGWADLSTADRSVPPAAHSSQHASLHRSLGRDALARAVLQRQQRALQSRSKRDYLSTWDTQLPGVAKRAAAVYDNLQTLGVTVLATRYVAADLALTPSAERRVGDVDAWAGRVVLRWRLRPYDDRATARSVLTYTFVRRGRDAVVADVTASPASPEPVWLRSHLVVRGSQRTLAAAGSAQHAARLHRLVVAAVADVSRVVPTWHGKLVVYEPATSADFRAVLGTTPGSYADIAAVTATVDGSQRRAASVAIVVNPAVFDQLSPIGSRVVISHEAAHAATGAAAGSMPLWVAEGFADYVGVGSVHVPLEVSAGAAIRDIRRHGLPAALPRNAEFAASGDGLEVAYEEAWLAARLIAQLYGRARLVAFYQHVVSARRSLPASLRSQLGTTITELTSRWRSYLRAVARATA